MSAEKFVSLCFTLRNQAHINHLTTTSFAQHKALDDFYNDIVGIADEFAETYQGRYGLIDAKYVTTNMSTDSVKMLEQARSWIENYRKELADNATDLQNILDSVLGLINRTLYKLVNLK